MTILQPTIVTTIGELRQLCQTALIELGDNNDTQVNITINDRGVPTICGVTTPDQWNESPNDQNGH